MTDVTTFERFLVGAAFCIAGLLVSAWLSAPPAATDAPSPLPTDVAMLCSAARGTAAPDLIERLSRRPNVPPLLAAAALEYAGEPTPGALQRLQMMCP